ncbi:MAG: htr8 [Frankiales bacterium]|nr:htr8 [Frankiales bacterium]
MRGTGAVRDLLPTGGGLDQTQWRHRHAAIVVLLVAHLPALLLLALARGQRPAHVLPELLVPAAAVVLARGRSLPDLGRAVVASLGLASCSALLVHLTGGSIEAHFHFFVVVSLVAFYERWLPLGATVAFVVLHHLVLGLVDPRLLHGRPGAAAEGARWFAVHAVAIGAQCAVALAHWRAHERTLAEERRLGRQVLEREAARQEAARQAEALALAADVAHRVNTPVQYAADNARYLGEAVVELSELVSLTRTTLEALPPEQAADTLQRLRQRHRQWQSEWAGDTVQEALGDCLAGLEEVSSLVLALQEVAAPVPRPRTARTGD